MARLDLPVKKADTTPEILKGHGLVAPPPILIEGPGFTGTLAALFLLAREARVDLLEIATLPICEALFAYFAARPASDSDEAAAGIAVLAYLVERKAWSLVPRPDAEPEPAEDPASLPEPYPEAFAAVVDLLREGHAERARLFFRTAEISAGEYEVPLAIGEVGAGDLARAFERLLRRAAPPAKVETLARPRPDLQETMRGMLARLSKSGRPLVELFAPGYTRADAVFGFLALLELVRLGQAAIRLAGEEVLFARP